MVHAKKTFEDSLIQVYYFCFYTVVIIIYMPKIHQAQAFNCTKKIKFIVQAQLRILKPLRNIHFNIEYKETRLKLYRVKFKEVANLTYLNGYLNINRNFFI